MYKNFYFLRFRMKIRVMKKTKVLLEKPLPLKVSYWVMVDFLDYYFKFSEDDHETENKRWPLDEFNVNVERWKLVEKAT